MSCAVNARFRSTSTASKNWSMIRPAVPSRSRARSSRRNNRVQPGRIATTVALRCEPGDSRASSPKTDHGLKTLTVSTCPSVLALRATKSPRSTIAGVARVALRTQLRCDELSRAVCRNSSTRSLSEARGERIPMAPVSNPPAGGGRRDKRVGAGWVQGGTAFGDGVVPLTISRRRRECGRSSREMAAHWAP